MTFIHHPAFAIVGIVALLLALKWIGPRIRFIPGPNHDHNHHYSELVFVGVALFILLSLLVLFGYGEPSAKSADQSVETATGAGD